MVGAAEDSAVSKVIHSLYGARECINICACVCVYAFVLASLEKATIL